MNLFQILNKNINYFIINQFVKYFSMSYLDKRLNEFQTLIDDCAPTNQPIMLLLDNINLYHGNRRHHRLLKIKGPKRCGILQSVGY